MQPVTGAVPCPRAYHTATLVGSEMFILGGEGVNNMSNDLHVLNTDNWEWRRPETFGNIPQPKKRHTTVLVRNCLYVWGGWCMAVMDHIHDLDILSLDNYEWRQAEQFGPVPCARAGHVSKLRGDLFFVWGGFGPKNQQEWMEVYYFDVTDDNITWRKKKPMGRGQPQQRSDMCSAISEEGQILLYGGLIDARNNVCSTDMFQLDISKIY